MEKRTITDRVHFLPSVHWNRRLFDALIPLPDGTSYNAYLERWHLVDALVRRNVKVHLFDLAVTDLGKLAISLVDAATLIVGTPTVHVGPHPVVFSASHLANCLRPKLRFASIIGSYGWSSKAIDRITALIPNLKVDILDPVLCRGYPREDTFRALDALADAVAEKHAALT